MSTHIYEYYDKSIPDYETVLTPSDFEMGAHITDVLQFNGEQLDVWDSDAMYNTDKFEGDIANDLNSSTIGMFLRGAPENGLDGANFANAIRNRLQLWPGNKIPYAISSQYSSYSRSMIASSMEEYNKHTCVQWVPKTNSDQNYVYVYPDRGCYSMVGKTGGRQTLSLGNGCIQKGIIIHEMMHAVGFFHEQSRTDRDDFITIMWNNIQPGMQGQFEKYPQTTIQYLGTEYDFNSIMHYGPKAFSRNGLPTIVPKKKANIGQRSGFSQTDAYKINALYGCPTNGKPPPPPITEGTGTPGTTKPTATSKPIIQPGTSTAKIIIPLTGKPVASSTTAKPYPSPPTLPTVKNVRPITGTIPPPPVFPECKNTRPDCDQLAQQGWCKRNPPWMKDNCPIACGFCKPPPSCEDLRVDCPELVKKRYCILAPNYMKNYCAKSCGFCTVAPVTEVPDTAPVTRGIEVIPGRSTTVQPSIVTHGPFVTFWPTILPIIDRTTQPSMPATGSPPTPFPCRDLKHFCPHWKNAGFCEGIFHSYMKKNCPASCGYC